ncbi:pilus assembly protein TadG-related protein [Kribbella capetownensis]
MTNRARRHLVSPNQRGSATVLSLLAVLLLLTALTVATLWSSVSTARHKLSAAADLTALSAAQALLATTQSAATPPTGDSGTPPHPAVDTPCEIADRIATLHKVRLTSCHPTDTTVTITVTLQLHVPAFAHPTLTTTSRAGPL